jgi:NAD(P)-dependent dehydrogenase (short-subunit alcohol dehydrogenase family)
MEPDVKASQVPSHVAIVTGGGRGLGRAMVLGLAQAGIHVVATAARERTEIEAVAEEVRQSCDGKSAAERRRRRLHGFDLIVGFVSGTGSMATLRSNAPLQDIGGSAPTPIQ